MTSTAGLSNFMNTDLQKILILWLKEYRRVNSLSQEETAKIFKVTLSTYRNWETGRFAPSKASHERIRKLMKLRMKQGITYP
tara:strand:+ start:963 stop:1208 length:246 start_codon:yes stop_codon:yes gene_type:complete